LRALTISAHGGTDKLEFRTDVAEPEVKAGFVRVRIKAAALNQLDIFIGLHMYSERATACYSSTI
jgi:NADPH:quinone reductase-like Zn-dependent oxidoreductase